MAGLPPDWVAGVSGATAAAVSRFVVAPLDVVRLRLQVQAATAPRYTGVLTCLRTIVRDEGVLALWSGNLTAEIMAVCWNGVQFSSYVAALRLVNASPGLQAVLGSEPGRAGTRDVLFAGATAGVAATLATYPIDLVRTRLAVQGTPRVYRGIGDVVRMVVARDGVFALYRGCSASVAGSIPYVGVQFATYERIKQSLSDPKSSLGHVGAGAAAGGAAKLVAMPWEVVRRRHQMIGMPSRVDTVRSGAGIIATAAHIVRSEGLAALYAGTVPAVVKVIPGTAIRFALYERMLHLLMDS